MQRLRRYSQLPSRGPEGKTAGQQHSGGGDVALVLSGAPDRPARPRSPRLSSAEPCDDALPDQVALELRDRREDVEEQPAGRCRRVDCLIEDDEVDAEGRQFLGKCDEMMGTASQTVELRNNDHINAPGPGRDQEGVESKATLDGTGDATIYELNRRPSSRRDEGPEGIKLVFGTLIRRRLRGTLLTGRVEGSVASGGLSDALHRMRRSYRSRSRRQRW